METQIRCPSLILHSIPLSQFPTIILHFVKHFYFG